MNGVLKVGGGVVFWSLAQWYNRSSLAGGLESLNLLHMLPPERPVVHCLRSALAAQFKGHIIRNLLSPADIEVIKVHPGEDRNTYEQIMVGRVDVDTCQVKIRPYDADMAAKIIGEFNLARGLVSGDSITDILTRYLDKQGGTRLRPGGGIYWLPDHKLDDWQQLTQVVESCASRGSCACHLLRHVMDGDAVRAIQAAITEEIETEAARLFEEVSTGSLGARALTNREELARELAAKVKLFEGLLNVSLASLKKSCEDAEAAAAAASLLIGSGSAA